MFLSLTLMLFYYGWIMITEISVSEHVDRVWIMFSDESENRSKEMCIEKWRFYTH